MRRAFALALLLGTSGCALKSPPEVATPTPVLPAAFAAAPGPVTPATVESVAALLPADDPAFTALSAALLTDAPRLSEAVARIEGARARAARVGANARPDISIGASAQGSRTNPDQFGAALPPGVSIDTTRAQFGGNVGAGWEIDLFGRLRNEREAAAARLDAATLDAAAVRNALTAELAVAVIDWRTIEARGAAIDRDIADARALARLAGIRERAGLAPGFDRLRAEAAAVAATRRRDALAIDRARLVDQLVTLTARPGAEVVAAFAVPAPAAGSVAVPAALPSTLLEARPDVRAAAARLAATDRDLAAIAARRFPRVTLSATLGLLAFGIGGLFDTDALVGSVGSGITAPLFDFGRIAADIDAGAADKAAAFAQYRAAVFGALGDAEGAYLLIEAADREAATARAEVALADRQVALAQVRYRAGLADFLTVLDARRTAEGTRERASLAEGQARRARALLWQALGGTPLRSAGTPSQPAVGPS